jgi:hypothetical protein
MVKNVSSSDVGRLERRFSFKTVISFPLGYTANVPFTFVIGLSAKISGLDAVAGKD